jgi:hypothetical protein
MGFALFWFIMAGITIGLYYGVEGEKSFPKHSIVLMDLVILAMWPIILGKLIKGFIETKQKSD